MVLKGGHIELGLRQMKVKETRGKSTLKARTMHENSSILTARGKKKKKTTHLGHLGGSIG